MTPETLADLDNWKPERVEIQQLRPTTTEGSNQRWDKIRTMRKYHEALSELLKTENFFPEQYAKLEQELWAVSAWLRKHDNKH